MYRWMVGASMTTPCQSDGHGIWSCGFSRPGGYRALAVWSTEGETRYPVAAPYTQFRDLSGKTRPLPDRSLIVGPRPLLLENRDI